jgi:hypothetical protein
MTKWTIPDTPSPEAIVRAALERAADWCEEYSTHHGSGMFDKHSYACAEAIRAFASDPAEVAAIIMAAGRIGDE